MTGQSIFSKVYTAKAVGFRTLTQEAQLKESDIMRGTVSHSPRAQFISEKILGDDFPIRYVKQ